MKYSKLKNIVLLIVFSVSVSFCTVQKSAITGNKRAYGYSWEKEKKIGQQSDKQIQQQYGVYEKENVDDFVKNLGDELLSVSHMRRDDTPKKYKNTDFTFRVLDSPIINAFALPGGYVYVTRGLLAHVENEAQLAVVMGHEIGHVAARHSSQSALEQQVGQLALAGSAIAGQELLGVPGKNILGLGSQATKFLFLKYGRDDERESDKLGAEYAAMKHFKAADAAGFFSTLRRQKKQSGQSIPEWQSSHPDPSERANTIPELAEKWRKKGYEQTKENTEQFMKTIDGMTFGKDPRKGYTKDGMFYHPELAFRFEIPENWRVQNQPSQVAIFNKDQNAVSVMKIDGKADSPKASVSNVLNQEGFKVISQEQLRNNDLQGYRAKASAMTKEKKEYQFYVYAISYNNQIYQFTSYSLANNFSNFLPRFKQITSSFAELENQQILSIQPATLQTIKVQHTAPFSSFIDTNNLPMDTSAQDLAILNQVELDESIEAGSWIKVPRR